MNEPTLEESGALVDTHHVVYNLDGCTFVYKGRSVPGEKLAELLGLLHSTATCNATRQDEMQSGL
jgi:hypothetical protein